MAGVIVFIFTTYEVVERTWLADADKELLYLLHIIRGVGASIVATLLVVVYILRTGPSMFPPEAVQDRPLLPEEPSEEDRAIHFSHWFIRMRWLACTVAIVLTLVIVKVLSYLDAITFWPLMLLGLCLFAINVIYIQMLKRRWLVRHLPEIQIGFDLLILTAMLHYSGGIENPLLLAYVFHIIICGILLGRAKCYATVGVAFVLFGALAFAEMAEVIEHYTLLIFPHVEQEEHLYHAAHDPVYVTTLVSLQFIFMALTAYFITTIMNQLRSEEEQRQAVRRRLERVIQASGAGFAIVDNNLKPVWANDQIEDWLRLPEDADGNLSSLLEEWTGGERGAEAETFRDGKLRVVDRQLVDRDGNTHFFQVTLSPLSDSAGKVYEVVELTQDVTERKRLEDEMARNEKMMVLGVMAAGIAHEIGNPLASISTRLRLLEEAGDEVSLEDSLDLLQGQIDRISRIVHGISRFARPGKGEWTSCQVNGLVNETLNVLNFHRQAKRCRIDTELAPLLPEIMVIKDQIIQALLNLGLNALEAMPKGGTLTIRTCLEEQNLHIAFSDTGTGVEDAVRSKIFDAFFSTKEDEAGMGLGLSIAHNIVKAHSGRIDVHNNPEGGAVFEVILPIRQS